MKIEVKNADWLIIWQRCRQQQWQQCRFCRLWNGQQVTLQKSIWPWTLIKLTLEVKERFLLYQSFQIQCPGISTLKVGWFNFFFARLVSSAQSVEGVPTMTPQWCWDPRFDIFLYLTQKQTTDWLVTIVRTKTMFSETLTWNPTASSASPRGECNYWCHCKNDNFTVDTVDKSLGELATYFWSSRYKVSALNIAETVTTLVDQGSMSL